MSRLKQLQGLRALIGDAVEHGASAIERVHLATARRPFAVLEQIPGVAEPALVIRGIHDTIVTGVYGTVRLVNRSVGEALDAALSSVDEPPRTAPPAGALPSRATPLTEHLAAQRHRDD